MLSEAQSKIEDQLKNEIEPLEKQVKESQITESKLDEEILQQKKAKEF